MKISNLLLVIILLALTQTHASSQSITNYISSRKDGKIDPGMKGYWESIGGGYILDATGDSILLYSFTSHFCYKEKNDYLEGLLNSQATFKRDNERLTILMADYGSRSNQVQIEHHYQKIKALPEGTLSFAEMTRLNPPALFNLFIETMRENYAFSQERGIDWDSIHSKYAPRVTPQTTNDELFSIIGEVVTLTKDQHTKIISETGQTLQYRGNKSADTVMAAFKEQSAISNQNDYFNAFFNQSYKNISDSLLDGKGKKFANGKIEWGNLSKSVGYIHIYSFNDFASKGFTRKQQMDSITYALDQAITGLAGTDALILDVSFNFGGYDAAALTIAGFFTEMPVYAYNSQVFSNGRFYDASKVYVYPAGKVHYAKPVYLLITDITRSAAEVFALSMKSLPQVKLAGTNSLGIQSSMLGKSIGNFYCTLSNQRLVARDGKYYEVTGLGPDLPLTVFSKENIFEGHMKAVRSIQAVIEKH